MCETCGAYLISGIIYDTPESTFQRNIHEVCHKFMKVELTATMLGEFKSKVWIELKRFYDNGGCILDDYRNRVTNPADVNVIIHIVKNEGKDGAYRGSVARLEICPTDLYKQRQETERLERLRDQTT